MNIPFIEHRVVSVAIEAGQLRWMELSKVGARIKVIGHGELSWSESVTGRQEVVKEVTASIQGDVFEVTLSAPELALEVSTEEIPFFEDAEAQVTWIATRKEELAASFSEQVLALHHVAMLGDDVQRVVFQVVDEPTIEELEHIFLEGGAPLSHIYSGITEYGYSQALNPAVVEGLHSVLLSGEAEYLIHYKDGALQGVHLTGVNSEEETSYRAEQARSLVQSEELAHQLELGSSRVYASDVEPSNQQSLHRLTPFDGKKEVQGLSKQYFMAFGAGVKSFYPELDQFECASTASKEKSRASFAKNRSKKLAVLLWAPIVLLFLGIYVWSSATEYQLKESSQVIEAIEDKLALVQAEQAEVQRLLQAYTELQGSASQQTNTAKIFTILNETLPEEVTLERVELSGISEEFTTRVSLQGVAGKEPAITAFMEALASHEWSSAPQLVTTSRARDGSGTEFSIWVEASVQ